MTRRSAMLALLVALGLAGPSRAAPSDATLARAKALYAAGLADFDAGRFAQAEAEFQAGYVLQPRPLFLFNAAQAARRAGRPDEALALYQKFVRLDPNAPERGEADRHIAELEPLAPRPAPAPEVTPPASPPAPAAPAPAPVARPAAQPAPTAAAAAPRPGSWHRDPLGGALLGVGTAVLVAGAVLTALGGASLDAASQSYSQFDMYQRADGGRVAIPMAASGGVGLGVGAALIVGAAIRYHQLARREARVEVSGRVAPGLAQVTLSTRF